jgi:hypothetical protein
MGTRAILLGIGVILVFAKPTFSSGQIEHPVHWSYKDVRFFEKTVIFHQKVMLTSKDAVVRGKITFMTCNDQKCLPPDEVDFSIAVK